MSPDMKRCINQMSLTLKQCCFHKFGDDRRCEMCRDNFLVSILNLVQCATGIQVAAHASVSVTLCKRNPFTRLKTSIIKREKSQHIVT